LVISEDAFIAKGQLHSQTKVWEKEWTEPSRLADSPQFIATSYEAIQMVFTSKDAIAFMFMFYV